MTAPDYPLEFLPEKAAWWPQKKTLILSDVHIGKAAHFRKNGVAIPPDLNRENHYRLAALLLDFKPDRLLIIGDLIHSTHNREWDDFVDMRQNFASCEWMLVKGNHDILSQTDIENSGISVCERLDEDMLSFVHEPLPPSAGQAKTNNGTPHLHRVCGHLHPAVRLYGHGRQTLKLPCFWVSHAQTVLPAFGSFTGSHVIKAAKNDRVVAIADHRLFEV